MKHLTILIAAFTAGFAVPACSAALPPAPPTAALIVEPAPAPLDISVEELRIVNALEERADNLRRVANVFRIWWPEVTERFVAKAETYEEAAELALSVAEESARKKAELAVKVRRK